MQNRKTDVCSRLFNWLYCLASVACAVLGPRVLHAHQAPARALDAVRLEGTRPQIDGVRGHFLQLRFRELLKNSTARRSAPPQSALAAPS